MRDSLSLFSNYFALNRSDIAKWAASLVFASLQRLLLSLCPLLKPKTIQTVTNDNFDITDII